MRCVCRFDYQSDRDLRAVLYYRLLASFVFEAQAYKCLRMETICKSGVQKGVKGMGSCSPRQPTKSTELGTNRTSTFQFRHRHHMYAYVVRLAPYLYYSRHINIICVFVCGVLFPLSLSTFFFLVAIPWLVLLCLHWPIVLVAVESCFFSAALRE